jgi:hypothetical protein
MKIRAVKGPRNRFFVTRDDGSEVYWDWPSEGTLLPHDLCHYVMEKKHHLAYGVWGLIAAGVDWGTFHGPGMLQRADAFVKSKVGVDASELLQAEQLANSVRNQEMAGEQVPPEIEEMQKRWSALKDGEWIDLAW